MYRIYVTQILQQPVCSFSNKEDQNLHCKKMSVSLSTCFYKIQMSYSNKMQTHFALLQQVTNNTMTKTRKNKCRYNTYKDNICYGIEQFIEIYVSETI